MGSQINFFLGPSDLRDLRAIINGVDDSVILSWLSKTPRPVEALDILPEFGKENLRVLIARRKDTSTMQFRPRKGHDDFFEATNHNLVIELDRPYVSKSFIRAGRLYREDNFWLTGGLASRKPEDWINWGKRLFAKCKRSLTLIDDLPFYAGKEAIEMRKNGVLFQQLDDPKNLVCKE